MLCMSLKNITLLVLIYSGCCSGQQARKDKIQVQIQELEQEDTQLKNKFKQALGITEKEWRTAIGQADKLFDVYDEEFKQEHCCSGPIHSDLEILTKNLLREKGIDFSQISLINHGAPPIAYKKCIGLSIDFFKKYHATPEESEALIMHEIIHILYQDAVVWRAMFNLVDQAFILKRPLGLLHMRAWALFRERRADILAGLSGHGRAEALAHFYQKLSDSKDFNTWIDITHPKLKKRVNYLLALDQNSGEIKDKRPSFFTQVIKDLKTFFCLN